MSTPNSLAGRLARLRERQAADTGRDIPVAAPLAHHGSPGCQAYLASFAQARLWFLHQLEPGLTAYHMPALWRLSGPLDTAALNQALAALIERHPSLRTSFCMQGSEVVQIIHPPTPFHLDPEPLADRNPDAVIEQWLEQERTTPFDLASGQLLRARLLAVDHQHHLLLLNHHHIASDGWSRSVLVRDLTALYNARRSGQASELAPLQVRYHDYAAWQRQRLSGDRLQTLQDYWIPQLTGLEPLELPSDHPRPSTPSHRGASVAFQITPELLAPFEQLCRLEGATLQMGLLALLALLLHRTSRQEDFAIGVPIWGRNHPDLEPLIGFFINTLPVRTRFTPEQSFRELLQQVKASSLAAYDNQELPFEQMVEALNLPRDTSRNPLVQVMLQLIELPEASLINLEGVAADAIPIKSESAKLDLSFFLYRSADHGLKGSIAYATDLFSSDRMERLCCHLLSLLSSALEAPDSPAASLCLLPDSERLLIESWQHGPTIDVPDLCVHQLFEQQAGRTPDAISLIFEDQQLTYQELNARANQLAHHLNALGVGPEVIVAVCLERSVELIVSLLAILKAGGAYLPIDPNWPEERRWLLLKESRSQILINKEGALSSDHEVRLNEAFSPNDSRLAYVIYTSGSTGVPKGVMIEHRALAVRALDVIRRWDLGPGRSVLCHGPISFDMTLRTTLIPLASGAKIVLASESECRDPRLLIDLIEKTQCDRVSMTPSQWQSLLDSGFLPAAPVHAYVTAEPLFGDLAARLYKKNIIHLIHSYGPTEATIYCTALTVLRHHQGERIAIGRPLPNTAIRVLDECGRVCPIGMPGELCIGGAGLARGYFNNPELTAEKFIPDPFSSDPTVRLYKSGDLASWNPDGTLAFHGRIDQQIKLRGFRIEPGEIEAHLLAHPAVAQAVVLLRHDDPNNPRLNAYWVADASQPPTAAASSDQLRSFLSERLPDYMVPAAFVPLTALPLTANGKLDRQALPAPSFSGDRRQRIEPTSERERQLHSIWVEVLGHNDFGITDNFFAIGGHSLAAARLLSRIEQALGSAPPLAALFQRPTIADLASLLLASGGGGSGSTAPVEAPAQAIPAAEPLPGNWPQGAQAFPASYAQSRLWFLHQLEPDLTAYHLPTLWRLSGNLDLNALCLALADLIERHPTLRTSFCMQGSEVVQIIHPPVAFPLAAELLANRDPDAVIQEWLRQEASTPFDLASGLLLRARLLQVADDAHVFLLNHHHIASDGWSCSVLTRDLTELYNGHHGGRSAQLQPIRVHYQDYAVWQRQRLSGAHFKKLHDYWIAALTGLEPLEIPTDHLRPVTPSFQGSSHSFEIESALLEPFQELCRSEGATLQMGLLALVALLLHRYSRQEDFAIGIPIWGRSHPELEPLIGLFINTLPVRTRFSPELTFRQLLVQVKTTSIAAYEHQELPFERMVEALNLERDASRNPLVQVMLQLIELPESSPHNLDGLVVDTLPITSESSKLDLSFYLRRTIDQGLRVSISYAIDLFAADRIERLSTHLLTLLSSVLQAPDAKAHALRLLPEPERLLMASWQQGPRIQAPHLCVHQLFEQQVERSPDAIALIFEDQRLTYRELNARANQLAHHLIDLGVGPEVIVAISLQRSVELIVALFAILKAGGAYLSLDPAWPNGRTTHVLQSAHCQYIITQEDHDALSDVAASAVLIDPHRVQGLGLSIANPVTHSCQLGYLAYVNFTSGSTGAPKGIAMEHRAVALKCLSVCCEWELTAKDRVLALSSFGFDISLRETIFPLTRGCTSVLVAEEERKSPKELARLITSHAVTRIQATPSYWEQLVRHGIHTLNPTMAIAIGEALNPSTASSLCEAPQSRLLHLYGTTEAPGSCGMLYRQPSSIHTVSIGTPLQNTSIFILEASGHPCPIGIAGELHIGGEGLARGYLNNPELTAEKFIPDPFSSDPTARLYQSGDLASWNPDGTLAFHGRIDQQIKLRGFRIEPGEIEAHLLTHPAVAQAAVVLRNDDPANPRLIAYWVRQHLDPAAAASVEQLRAFLAERLPESMVPSAFLELEALPLTTNGKLDRQALPAPSFAAGGQQHVAPSTDLERQLHAIWVEVLGHNDFGVTDNFFWIGGHSILVMRLKQLVDVRLGFDIPIYTYFSEPTIAVFAQSLLCRDSVGDDSVALPLLSAHKDMTAFAPPLIQEFIAQQQVLLRHWPGELLPGHRFVRMLGDGDANLNLFWCFQGSNEFQALADHLIPGVNVFGMRSAHGIEGASEIYRNPSLLAFVAIMYAREMLALQPDGQPFVLGGNCQAGLLAVSIAHHLVGWGREVKMLILMEPRLERIYSGALAWRGPTGLIWGAESKFNPFLTSNKLGRSKGRIRHHIFRNYYRKKVTKSLVHAFGGGFELSFIPGVHGAFFRSDNIKGLASVIQAHVVTASAEGWPG